jgi:purine-binding chemotaxis protein CheW
VSVDDITVGMIVDSATEVVQLAQDAIEPAPPITGSIDSNYLDGVGKIEGRLLILLNVAKLLKPQEISQLAQI